MNRILIVEDSVLHWKVLKRSICSSLDVEVDVAETFAEAEGKIKGRDRPYFAALVDLSLPDSPEGAAVGLTCAAEIPTIVFTASLSEKVEDTMWEKPIIDYVLKGGAETLEHVVELLIRIQRNPSTKVMVVDDSALSRSVVVKLLRIHRYQILEAESGKDALALLKEHPDTSLVITDYRMPGMDGFELTTHIRRSHSRRRLAVMGFSALGNHKLSARFMKYGANDFITKPFSVDEFYCRVQQNVDMVEYMHEIRNVSVTDFLTGMSNRRYFFDTVGKLLSVANRGNCPTPAVAMIDVDHFKKFNDTYGHDVGDIVLKHLATILQNRFRTADIVARLGGEEFAVFGIDMDAENALEIFNALREEITADTVDVDGEALHVTVSIGVCCELMDSVDLMLKAADTALYAAKAQGRNRVMLAQTQKPS
jgi:diguanylate cyclase (GGDEF)-like protein